MWSSDAGKFFGNIFRLEFGNIYAFGYPEDDKPLNNFLSFQGFLFFERWYFIFMRAHRMVAVGDNKLAEEGIGLDDDIGDFFQQNRGDCLGGKKRFIDDTDFIGIDGHGIWKK